MARVLRIAEVADAQPVVRGVKDTVVLAHSNRQCHSHSPIQVLFVKASFVLVSAYLRYVIHWVR